MRLTFFCQAAAALQALQSRKSVQRDMSAAARAAVDAGLLHPDLSEARLERLPEQTVPLHPPTAARAERRRSVTKIGVERLEQGRAALRPASQKAVVD